MGIYLNPSADGFASIMKTGDYVDKTGLITYMNAVLNSSRNMLCSSRPRRFGKSYSLPSGLTTSRCGGTVCTFARSQSAGGDKRERERVVQ